MPDRSVSEFLMPGRCQRAVVRFGMSSSEVGSLPGPACALEKAALACRAARGLRQLMTWEKEMAWKTPKIVEVPVGMEINMYACAARK